MSRFARIPSTGRFVRRPTTGRLKCVPAGGSCCGGGVCVEVWSAYPDCSGESPAWAVSRVLKVGCMTAEEAEAAYPGPRGTWFIPDGGSSCGRTFIRHVACVDGECPPDGDPATPAAPGGAPGASCCDAGSGPPVYLVTRSCLPCKVLGYVTQAKFENVIDAITLGDGEFIETKVFGTCVGVDPASYQPGLPDLSAGFTAAAVTSETSTCAVKMIVAGFSAQDGGCYGFYECVGGVPVRQNGALSFHQLGIYPWNGEVEGWGTFWLPLRPAAGFDFNQSTLACTWIAKGGKNGNPFEPSDCTFDDDRDFFGPLCDAGVAMFMRVEIGCDGENNVTIRVYSDQSAPGGAANACTSGPIYDSGVVTVPAPGLGTFAFTVSDRMGTGVGPARPHPFITNGTITFICP